MLMGPSTFWPTAMNLDSCVASYYKMALCRILALREFGYIPQCQVILLVYDKKRDSHFGGIYVFFASKLLIFFDITFRSEVPRRDVIWILGSDISMTSIFIETFTSNPLITKWLHFHEFLGNETTKKKKKERKKERTNERKKVKKKERKITDTNQIWKKKRFIRYKTFQSNFFSIALSERFLMRWQYPLGRIKIPTSKDISDDDTKLHLWVRVKFWRSEGSLPLLPGPLWPGGVVYIMVISTGQIDLLSNYLY